MPFHYDPNEKFEDMPVPPVGDYDVAIVTAKDTRSKAGNDMIEFQTQIQGGEFANTTMFYYLVDNNSMTARNTHALCKSVAHSGPVIAQAFEGRRGRVHVVHETYNGKTRPKIARWLEPDSEQWSIAVPSAPATNYSSPPLEDPDDAPF